MCAIAHVDASSQSASLMHLKKACATSVYDTYCPGHRNKENERKQKHQI